MGGGRGHWALVDNTPGVMSIVGDILSLLFVMFWCLISYSLYYIIIVLLYWVLSTLLVATSSCVVPLVTPGWGDTGPLILRRRALPCGVGAVPAGNVYCLCWQRGSV